MAAGAHGGCHSEVVAGIGIVVRTISLEVDARHTLLLAAYHDTGARYKPTPIRVQS